MAIEHLSIIPVCQRNLPKELQLAQDSDQCMYNDNVTPVGSEGLVA